MTFVPNFPRQKAPFLGVQRVHARSGQIGPANFLGGASPLTPNATTIFRIGGFAGRSVILNRLGATALTVPADADGTILAKLVKYDASADAAVDITQDMSLEALVTREESFAELLTTLTQAQATMDAGDALEVHVTNNSAAIDTQPAGLVFVVEGFMAE